MYKKEPSNFEGLLKQLSLRRDFALPAVFCDRVFGSIEDDGLAMRVLLTMIWMSVPDMGQGEIRKMAIRIPTLKILSGFSPQGSSRVLIPILRGLKNEVVTINDHQFAIFDFLAIKEDGRNSFIEWVFCREIIAEFVDPKKFGIVNIEAISKLKKSMDFFFYRKCMLVCRRRKPEFRFTVEELSELFGITYEKKFSAFGQSIRASLKRISCVSGYNMNYEPIYRIHSACYAGLLFSVHPKETDSLYFEEDEP